MSSLHKVTVGAEGTTPRAGWVSKAPESCWSLCACQDKPAWPRQGVGGFLLQYMWCALRRHDQTRSYVNVRPIFHVLLLPSQKPPCHPSTYTSPIPSHTQEWLSISVYVWSSAYNWKYNNSDEGPFAKYAADYTYKKFLRKFLPLASLQGSIPFL